MRKATSLLFPAALVLASCSDFPDFGEPLLGVERPEIVDIAEIAHLSDAKVTESEALVAALEARIRNLRIRANRLKAPVIEPPLRRKMLRAVQRHTR